MKWLKKAWSVTTKVGCAPSFLASKVIKKIPGKPAKIISSVLNTRQRLVENLPKLAVSAVKASVKPKQIISGKSSSH